jgi:hypothetical protein
MLKAPWYRPEEDIVFTLFAMECEGDIDTRQGKIKKVIKLLAAAEDPNDFETQCRIYDEVGIDSDTFTEDEVQFIIREVARRCR